MAILLRRPVRTRRTHKLERRNRDTEQNTFSSSSSFCEPRNEKLPLDVTQKLERKLAELNASENVFKRWIYEIVTLVIAMICMASIIVILSKVSGKGLAGRDFALTVFTVLSKTTSAALLLPTSEALGQLKWNWLVFFIVKFPHYFFHRSSHIRGACIEICC